MVNIRRITESGSSGVLAPWRARHNSCAIFIWCHVLHASHTTVYADLGVRPGGVVPPPLPLQYHLLMITLALPNARFSGNHGEAGVLIK